MGLCRSCKNFVTIIANITLRSLYVVTVNLEFYCTFTPITSTLCLGRRGCIIRQKEFSRETEKSKSESFHGMNLAVIALVLNQSSFLLCFCFSHSGGPLKKIGYKSCCMVRQKEFPRKVEMSKVQNFYWNRLSNKSFSLNQSSF